MAGGGHHEPPVFTHFFPGMVAGIVLGGVLGAVVIAQIAAGSLQAFWQAARPIHQEEEACADLSGVRATSEALANGASLTSIVIGSGEETLLTMPASLLRHVSAEANNTHYLTGIASASQVAAFPAQSLYRLDLCAKTTTHLLGDTTDPVTIYGMSASGTWVMYAGATGMRIMNTQEHRVIALGVDMIPTAVAFSPMDNAFIAMFENGSYTLWTLSDDGNMFIPSTGTGTNLPAWTFQTAEEYAAEIT